jgi:peroxiredoxin
MKKLLLVGLAALIFVLMCSSDRVQTAPTDKDFTLTSIDGEEITLSKLKGKVVLIDFWATWCPPCRNSIPLFTRLYNKYHDQGFTVLGISTEEKSVLTRYRDENNVPYPILLGNKEVLRMYEVSAIPHILILDKNGALSKKQVGFAPELEREFEARIDSLIKL